VELWDGVEAWTYALAAVAATVVLVWVLARLGQERARRRQVLEDRFRGVLWRIEVVEGRMFKLAETQAELIRELERDWPMSR